MANIKISDLTAASAAADANEFEINEAGTSKKVTGAQISALVESNLGLGALATLSAVGTTQITDGSVTTAKLGADAVDGTKIADDAVAAEHIADNAVGADALNVTGNGTAGQALTSDGDGTFSWADAGGGGYAVSKITKFAASTTWTKQPTTELVSVTVVGGGGVGSGTGVSLNNRNNGAGGGGGLARALFNIAQAGNTQPITIGAGGTVTVPSSNPSPPNM